MQDDSKHIAEDRVPGNWQQCTSQMDVDAHLSDKEVSKNAPVKNEVVKEDFIDTNTKAIDKESSEAVFEMSNVELIELKPIMPALHF